MKKLSTRLFAALVTAVTVFVGFGMQVEQTCCNTVLSEAQMRAIASEYYSSLKYEDGFNDPSKEYRWSSILHNLEPQLDEGHLGDWHAGQWELNGQGGIVTQINPNLSKGYLDNPTAFDKLNQITDIVNDYGHKIWLYDESGYPSGTAGDKTLAENPDAVAKGIVMVSKSNKWFLGYRSSVSVGLSSLDSNGAGDGNEGRYFKIVHAYAKDSNGNVHPATVSDTNASFDGKDANGNKISGEWTLYVFVEKELYEGTHAQNNGSRDVHYINIMDKNAVATFINNTYKAYADKYNYLDQVVGIFTDEPSLVEKYQNTAESFTYAQLSWVDGLDKKFEEMHGYSLYDGEALGLIFYGANDNANAKIIRTNFRQTVAELVSQNYFAQISEFCRQNGTKLTGHGVLEEQIYDHVLYYGDLMKCLREMDIPGVDSLWGNPETYINNGVFMSVKYATSTETLMGKDRMTMVEFCADDINGETMTDEQREWVRSTLNLMHFQGITQVHSYFAIEYIANVAHAGSAEKAAAVRPWTDYFARLTYMSRNARWDGDIGIYYPINTNQAYSKPSNTSAPNVYDKNGYIKTVAKAIYENNMDFTVVDNQFILEAKIGNGTLYNDNVSFKAICMPAVELLPYDVLEKLCRFEKAGGRVYWLECKPTLTDITADMVTDYARREKITKFIELRDNISKVYALDEAMADVKTNFSYNVGGELSGVYVGKYKIDGATMYWLYNYNDSAVTIDVSTETTGVFDVYDPSTGDITQFSAESCSVTLDGNYAKLVIVEDALSEKYLEVCDVPLVTIDGNCAWLVIHNCKKLPDAALTYNGNKMYWSEKYGAYCYVLIGTDKPDTHDIGIVYGPPSETVTYEMDMNGSYRVDVNDAQFIYNLYCKPEGVTLSDPISALTYLNCDMNGDKVISVDDAQVIISEIFSMKK